MFNVSGLGVLYFSRPAAARERLNGVVVFKALYCTAYSGGGDVELLGDSFARLAGFFVCNYGDPLFGRKVFSMPSYSTAIAT